MGEIVKRVTHLWETWDIQVLVLTSLLIQVLLTLLAPLRKRCSSSFLMSILWVLYLSADAIAVYTIGLISSTLSDLPSKGDVQQADLVAFWAPFLLLHLGGPDTITALALEDNELWRRHTLQLVVQVIVTLYVFVISFRKSTGMLGPTLLIFIDGCIKYSERTLALYYASMDNFRLSQRPKSGPVVNYAWLMQEYSSAAAGSIPASIQCKHDGRGSEKIERSCNSEEDADHGTPTRHWYQVKETKEMVKEAYDFYDKFKGLLADALLSVDNRDGSRDKFLSRPAGQAFRIVEIELNFIYDVFFTKAFLLQKRLRYIRLLGSISVAASLIWFSVNDKSKYHHVDVLVTFVLLAGAIALDMIATFMFLLSDWYTVHVKQLLVRCSKWVTANCCGKSLWWWSHTRRQTDSRHKKWSVWWPWSHSRRRKDSSYRKWSLLSSWFQTKWWTDCCRSRWSQSISTYNLLEQCLKNSPAIHFDKYFILRWIMNSLYNVLIGWLYVRTKPVDRQLGDFVLEELKKKSLATDQADLIKDVCSARGNLVFQDDYLLVSEYLRPWTLDIDYDESLLIWHLATDLCYWSTADLDDPPQMTTSSNDNIDGEQLTDSTHGHDQQTDNTNKGDQQTGITSNRNKLKYNDRYISKEISDYLSYLIFRNQALVSPLVGIADIRFDDTCTEAKKFTYERLGSWSGDIRSKIYKFLWEKILCCRSTSEENEESARNERTVFEHFCHKVLEVQVDGRPMIAKGVKSKSVLFDACRLAKQLQMFEEMQWEIMAKVWVELLCYAAVRCSPRSHMAELNKGGQLITLVWLLMANLGLGERFRQEREFGLIELVVAK